MRKQMNISIPADKLHVLAAFDEVCQREDTSRSEAVLQLMAEYVDAYNISKGTRIGLNAPEPESAQNGLNELLRDALTEGCPPDEGESELPEWML